MTSTSLLSHPQFRLFWAGESVSLVGSAVTYVAFPLVAVLTLHASPLEIGVLAMAGRLPPLVFGAFVGVVVDWLPRRKLMIWSDLGRMGLLASVPVAAGAGVLTVGQLVVVSFMIGSLTLVFNVAYQAFLPSVVHRDQLAEGNGKLAASQSVAEVTGPGIAGWMMALVGPAGALLADAASFGVSAIALRALQIEEHCRPRSGNAPFWTATRSGFVTLWADPVLRSVTVSTSIVMAFSQFQMAVYFLFLVEQLHFGSGTIAVLFSISGIFGFFGAVFSDRISRRIGIGALIVGGQATQAVGGLLLASAAGSRLVAGAAILAGEVCFSVGLSVFAVSYVSLRQARIDDEVRGRVVGASRFITTALAPFAAVLGGAIGSLAGLRTTLAVGALGMLAGATLILRRDVLAVWDLSVPSG